MKRKLTALLLVLALTCLAACGAESPATDTPPATIFPPFYNATVEYGEPDLITDNTGPLRAYIRFPAIGGPAGGTIAAWARGVYQDLLDEIAGQRKIAPAVTGEVNVQFDSYLVDGRYAGIIESGSFSASYLAHPVDVIRTFNIDTESGTLLQNADILDYSQLVSILSVLRGAVNKAYPGVEYPAEMDEAWLEHIAVGHDGVIVVLARNKALPGYLGTVKVTLPYDKLGNGTARTAYRPGASHPGGRPSRGPFSFVIRFDEYLRQLYLYAVPVAEQYGPPGNLVFNCFRTGSMISEPFSQAAFEETIAWALRIIEDTLREKDWLPCEDAWKCRYLCDVAGECEYFI